MLYDDPMASNEDQLKILSEADLQELVDVGGAFPRGLRLSEATDSGLTLLSGRLALRDLRLDGTQITDAGLRNLTDLDLHELSLTRTSASDAGLAHIGGLTSLKILWLGNTRVTDAGLIHLENLKDLQMLDLYETAVTTSGIEDLLKVLPSCNIVA